MTWLSPGILVDIPVVDDNPMVVCRKHAPQIVPDGNGPVSSAGAANTDDQLCLSFLHVVGNEEFQKLCGFLQEYLGLFLP
jgi:hypothetical protein